MVAMPIVPEPAVVASTPRVVPVTPLVTETAPDAPIRMFELVVPVATMPKLPPGPSRPTLVFGLTVTLAVVMLTAPVALEAVTPVELSPVTATVVVPRLIVAVPEPVPVAFTPTL